MTGAPKLLLDLQELADALAVHRSQVYRMLQRGELPLPILHVGRSPRVRVADVEAWLERLAEDADVENGFSMKKSTPAVNGYPAGAVMSSRRSGRDSSR